jgi:hypothetical protein
MKQFSLVVLIPQEVSQSGGFLVDSYHPSPDPLSSFPLGFTFQSELLVHVERYVNALKFDAYGIYLWEDISSGIIIKCVLSFMEL